MSGPEADIKVGNALPLETFQLVQLFTTSNLNLEKVDN